jgi:DNA-binding transcriptional ArsR family regulator
MADTTNSPGAGPDIAAVAGLLGDGTRTRMLAALADGRALPASELATTGRISRSTASEHLTKLVSAGLLSIERCGRHSYYRLAGSEVSDALEALAVIAPQRPPTSLRTSREAEAIGRARTCYDHVAGTLGVRIATSLHDQGLIRSWSDGFAVNRAAWERTPPLDVACETSKRRPLTRACLDWSERRHHLAGALGAALTQRLFERGWITRSPLRTRVLVITDEGRQGLADAFGIRVPQHERGSVAAAHG